jgi:hypothetical protein
MYTDSDAVRFVIPPRLGSEAPPTELLLLQTVRPARAAPWRSGGLRVFHGGDVLYGVYVLDARGL